MYVLFEACRRDTLVSLVGDPTASVVGRSWQWCLVYLSFYQTGHEALAPAGASVCWRFSEKRYSVCIQSGQVHADLGDLLLCDQSAGGHYDRTAHFAFWDVIALYVSSFVGAVKPYYWLYW